ncbi:MAG: hypothetical protein AAFR60_09355, partial [Pseudomonadota bacterium]
MACSVPDGLTAYTFVIMRLYLGKHINSDGGAVDAISSWRLSEAAPPEARGGSFLHRRLAGLTSHR